MMSREEGKNWADKPIQVKMSGDGARMTRNSSFILLSFSLLQAGDDVMSAGGNHTVAIVKGSECYQTLQESFGTVFNEINKLKQYKQPVTINNSSFHLEFFLGGDYKFLLLMLGIKSATSIYACLWCKIAKTNRWNMEFDLEHYNKSPLQRTLQEVITLGRKKGNTDKYSCEHEPLLKVELDHVVLDELHLLLCIMDVLINNLVKETAQWDKKENFNKEKLTKITPILTICKQTLDPVAFHFKYGKRQMQMVKGQECTISQAYLELIRRNFLLSYQTNCQIVFTLKQVKQL